MSINGVITALLSFFLTMLKKYVLYCFTVYNNTVY